jgi:hypothetical protein
MESTSFFFINVLRGNNLGICQCFEQNLFGLMTQIHTRMQFCIFSVHDAMTTIYLISMDIQILVFMPSNCCCISFWNSAEKHSMLQLPDCTYKHFVGLHQLVLCFMWNFPIQTTCGLSIFFKWGINESVSAQHNRTLVSCCF